MCQLFSLLLIPPPFKRGFINLVGFWVEKLPKRYPLSKRRFIIRFKKFFSVSKRALFSEVLLKKNFFFLKIFFKKACRLLRALPKLSLDAFLLTPVQRICRYPLQLLELLKATPPNHPDRLALELAQKTMKLIASKVNDGKRRVDAIQKIWLWQNSVHGFRVEIFKINFLI